MLPFSMLRIKPFWHYGLSSRVNECELTPEFTLATLAKNIRCRLFLGNVETWTALCKEMILTSKRITDNEYMTERADFCLWIGLPGDSTR